jgi:adenylate kinase family enzyme
MVKRRIHIFGASGSGTTTLGARIAGELGCLHLDTDDFYWEQTELAFQEKRPVEERLRLIDEAIGEEKSWVMSGALCSWSDSLVGRFTDVVFLWVPWGIREQRLRDREAMRFGKEALEPGGEMHLNHAEFIEWASRYDTAGLEQRSRYSHEKWLQELPERIRIVAIHEAHPVDRVVELAMNQLGLRTP